MEKITLTTKNAKQLLNAFYGKQAIMDNGQITVLIEDVYENKFIEGKLNIEHVCDIYNENDYLPWRCSNMKDWQKAILEEVKNEVLISRWDCLAFLGGYQKGEPLDVAEVVRFLQGLYKAGVIE